jgi:leader peptidase (prepilin peptidase)/N-methyltransferase
VKLAGMMGLFLGRSVAPAVMIALLSGVFVGLLVMSAKGVKAGRKTAVPFGPFLALGAIVAVYAGQALIDVYLDGVY